MGMVPMDMVGKGGGVTVNIESVSLEKAHMSR